MTTGCSVYLDVETDRDREVTIVGMYVGRRLIQLVGREISRRGILRELPGYGVLYTFNGDAFDIPALRRATGLDLSDYESVDLRTRCKECNLVGGQKAIERRVRFRRSFEVLNYWQIVGLWDRYVTKGDLNALDRLKRYNAEDVHGMVAIRRFMQQGRRRPSYV